MKTTQSNLLRGALASLVIIALGMAGAYEAKGAKPPKPVAEPTYLVRAAFADETDDAQVNILPDDVSCGVWDYWDHRDSECADECGAGAGTDKSDLGTGGRWLFSMTNVMGRCTSDRRVVLIWEPLDSEHLEESPDPNLEAKLGYDDESVAFSDKVGVWIDADVFKDTDRDDVVFKIWEGPDSENAGRNWQLSYLAPLYVVKVDADTAVLTTENPITHEHDAAAAVLMDGSGRGKPVRFGTYWMPMTIMVHRISPTAP